MTGMIERVNRWCRAGDFTTVDLAIFRILFASFVLVWSGPWSHLAARPGKLYDPPPGPMMLFRELPDAWFLDALGFDTTLAAGFLLVGLWTRLASASVAVTIMLEQGFSNSFGKIDHQNLLFIVPAVMVFSAWGLALSADSRRAGSGTKDQPAQWPLRLLAFMVGIAFVTAGYEKLRGGWLSLDSHATQGILLRRFIVKGHDEFLAPYFAQLTWGPFWEMLDWFTVLLELGLVFAVLSWRAFRVALAVTAQFHLGILLMMNITFFGNILAYGAFVRWQQLLRGPREPRPVPWWLALVAAVVIGGGAWELHHAVPFLIIARSMVVLGALIGLGYLVWLTVGALRRKP
jgi:uncharacterized membrane protein YphA (DoxX/SURF4 family)